MKETKQIVVDVCDFCKTKESYRKCRVCEKDVCYDCEKAHGIIYSANVWCSGSGDSFYCHECDKKATGVLIDAYRAIRSLRMEEEGFRVDFKRRMEKAEEHVKGLLK